MLDFGIMSFTELALDKASKEENKGGFLVWVADDFNLLRFPNIDSLFGLDTRIPGSNKVDLFF